MFLGATGLAMGFCLWQFACLPDPGIQVPDLAPPPLVDGAMAARMDAPSGDLGPAKWSSAGPVTNAPLLRAAWVADPGISEAFLVGQGGVVLHRVGGGGWQTETSGTMADLYGVAARSSTEVYAVGSGGVILRRVGGTWLKEGQELGLSATLYGVTAIDTGEVVAVGDSGVVARRQTAGVWTLETGSGLTGASLRAVFGSELEGMYAVGMAGVIVRRISSAWQPNTLPIDPGGSGNYYGIAGSADGTAVHICGENGLVLHLSADGTHWQVDKLLPPMGMMAPLHFYSLYYQDGTLLAAGTGGTVELYSPEGTWSVEPTGTTSDLYGLAGAGLRSVLAVGSQGTILRRM